MKKNKDRVVITGFGVKFPGGYNNNHFLETLQSSRCALEIVHDITPNKESIVVGKVHDDLGEFGTKKYKRHPRLSTLALSSTQEAIEHSGLTQLENQNIGVFFGTAIGSTLGYEDIIPLSMNNNYRKFPLNACAAVHSHSLSSSISHYLGVKGISKTVTTGCTAGLEALQDAILYLKAGLVDTAVVGGVDAALSQTTTFAFMKLRSMPVNQGFDSAGSPFDLNSKGFVVSEGSGTIIVELESHALQRGAKIYGVIDDILSINESVSLFESEETGEDMYQLMKKVSKGRKPDYINSQALGLQPNDNIEYQNAKKLFDNNVPITSIKGMVGHPFGASGIMQLISSLLSIEHSFIPATTRTSKTGFEDLNLVTEYTEQKVSDVLITSHGYGGNNVVTYLSKYNK